MASDCCLLPVTGLMLEATRKATETLHEDSSTPAPYSTAVANLPAYTDFGISPGFLNPNDQISTGTAPHRTFTNRRAESGVILCYGAKNNPFTNNAQVSNCKFRWRFFTATCYFKLNFDEVVIQTASRNYLSGSFIDSTETQLSSTAHEFVWDPSGDTSHGRCLPDALWTRADFLPFCAGGAPSPVIIANAADKYALAVSNNWQLLQVVVRSGSPATTYVENSILIDVANRGSSAGWVDYLTFITPFSITDEYEFVGVEPSGPSVSGDIVTSYQNDTQIANLRWSFVKNYDPPTDGSANGFPWPSS